ncbi:translation initiation factor IF-3 [Sporosalibacterium faouarense]|uniref:translation initiation factor IF-3 n=1 Tax=Sporosalibacterium faouarense TaxID=516123 RepID=UPI001FAFB9AB|nr:translation initiation factor IF-3 [Sporosalibacterium faouarense]
MVILSAFCYLVKKYRRCHSIKDLQINEQIRDREVRLIGADGEQVGIMATKEAQKIANDKRLDLVKVAPNARPAVCRIMDYGKYKYEMQKKEKEAKKNQKIINVKEVRLSPNIEEHDLNVKAKQAIKFLKNEDKVKVTVRFRGRELGHTELGREVLKDFAEKTSEVGVIEKRAKMEGRNMIMFLSPKKSQ